MREPLRRSADCKSGADDFRPAPGSPLLPMSQVPFDRLTAGAARSALIYSLPLVDVITTYKRRGLNPNSGEPLSISAHQLLFGLFAFDIKLWEVKLCVSEGAYVTVDLLVQT